jgi:hypothetical protein
MEEGSYIGNVFKKTLYYSSSSFQQQKKKKQIYWMTGIRMPIIRKAKNSQSIQFTNIQAKQNYYSLILRPTTNIQPKF